MSAAALQQLAIASIIVVDVFRHPVIMNMGVAVSMTMCMCAIDTGHSFLVPLELLLHPDQLCLFPIQRQLGLEERRKTSRKVNTTCSRRPSARCASGSSSSSGGRCAIHGPRERRVVEETGIAKTRCGLYDGVELVRRQFRQFAHFAQSRRRPVMQRLGVLGGGRAAVQRRQRGKGGIVGPCCPSSSGSSSSGTAGLGEVRQVRLVCRLSCTGGLSRCGSFGRRSTVFTGLLAAHREWVPGSGERGGCCRVLGGQVIEWNEESGRAEGSGKGDRRRVGRGLRMSMRGTGMHNVESGLFLCFVKVEMERGFRRGFRSDIGTNHWDQIHPRSGVT